MDVAKYERDMIEKGIELAEHGGTKAMPQIRELSALLLESRMLRLPAKERRYALATVRNLRAE